MAEQRARIPGAGPQAGRARKSLLRRILWIVSVAVAVSFMGFALVIDLRQRGLVARDVESKLTGAGNLAASAVANWLSGRMVLARAMADTIATMPERGPDLIQNAILAQEFAYSQVGTRDGGFYIAPFEPMPAGYDPRKRPWYQAPERARSPILTTPYVDLTTQKLVIAATVPILVKGELAGVFAAGLFLDTLLQSLAAITFEGTGFAFVVGDDGTILMHPNLALVGKPLSDLFTGSVPPITRTISQARTATAEMLVTFVPLAGLPGAKWHLAVALDPAQAYASLTEFRATALAAALGIVLLTVALLGRLLHQAAIRPLARMTQAMNALAAGKLDTAIPDRDRRDEIGAMAEAVEIFKRNAGERARLEQEERATVAAQRRRAEAVDGLIADFHRDISGSLDLVADASTILEGTARSLSGTADAGARNAQGAAAAAEAASANVRGVAAAAEALAASVGAVAQQAAASRAVAARAADTTRDTDGAVRSLVSVGGRISEIVDLIRTIAAQTDLLALNATIEAARAGEAGRGFAVVAQEVKSLAGQTEKATIDIANQIHAIQAVSGTAAESLRTIGTVITEINTIASDISAAVSQQGVATQEIAGNVQKAAAGAAAVTSHVVDVRRGSAATEADAGKVLDAASRLSQEATDLRRRVEHFLSAIRAA